MRALLNALIGVAVMLGMVCAGIIAVILLIPVGLANIFAGGAVTTRDVTPGPEWSARRSR